VANIRADIFYTELDLQLDDLEKFFVEKAEINTAIRTELDLFHVVYSVKLSSVDSLKFYVVYNSNNNN